MTLPEELVGYQHPDEITESDIDDEIWALVRSINRTDWMRTTCSCAGHPDTHGLHAWSTDLELSLAVRVDDIVGEHARYGEWLRLIRAGTPRALEQYGSDSTWWMFLQSTTRDQWLSEYWDFAVENWQTVKLVYEYETVGQREHMVSLMTVALEQIERDYEHDNDG